VFMDHEICVPACDSCQAVLHNTNRIFKDATVAIQKKMTEATKKIIEP
jgi:hypothetical protein